MTSFRGIAAPNHPTYYLSGMVRDSITLEPLPYASVTVIGHTSGSLTDEQGQFRMTAYEADSAMQVSCVGYQKKIVPIRKGMVNIYDVQLAAQVTDLHELVVTRQKYTKKNNPAVEFARKLREHGSATDPARHPHYNYDKYEIMTIGMNDFVERNNGSWAANNMDFLWEYVDTSEVSGKAVLNCSVLERAIEVNSGKEGQGERIIGLRHNGLDEIGELENSEQMFVDILREIDIYDSDINLLQQRFVSPLSYIAPDFYRFYLTDTVAVGDERCVVLSFYPRNSATAGFTGQIYVPVNDPNMAIRKVTMRNTKDLNINFIDNIYISQEYTTAPDGSRLKMRDDLTIEATIAAGMPGFYVRRNTAYSNHNFDDRPLADRLARDVYANRDDQFWDRVRTLQITENEKRMDQMMEDLRSVPQYNRTEKILQIIAHDYLPTSKKSLFDIGPITSLVSKNSVEDWRFRLGGMTTANLSRRWFARGYGAWGTGDHRWKYGAELEYSFIDKEYHSREFPMRSVRLTHTYDLDRLGQHFADINPDNFILSFRRMADPLMTYHRVSRLDFTWEFESHFSIVATATHERQYATPTLQFVTGSGRMYDRYDESSLGIQLRYAPGEKFLQTQNERTYISHDDPIITLSHKFAPRGFAGSMFTLNRTEITAQQRFWFSAFGYLDVLAMGGYIWSRTPYPELLTPAANLSYTIQNGSFALVNPLEFMADRYAQWELTYYGNGILFNYLPYLKKTKLREIVSFRGFYGELSRKNNPQYDSELFRFPMQHSRMHGPYMEISAGIDNIFKVFRLDYVWRLSYLHPGYPIDTRGLRFGVHLRF